MEKVQIAVAGAGPAGIAVAVEAAAADITKVAVLEKAPHACDTIVRLYRQGKRVDRVYRKVEVEPTGLLSFDVQSREEFLAWMEKNIDKYNIDIRLKTEVQDIRRQDEMFRISTGSGEVLAARLVVIATGIFGKPVKPSYPIPRGIKDRVYFSLPRETPVGKSVLVVGGGDSAAEAACFLSRNNAVTLSYRQAEFFRINEQNLCTVNECCRAENLNTMLGLNIAGIEGHDDRILVHYDNGRQIAYDQIYYFLGGSTPRSLLEKIGIEFDDGRAVTDQYGETNIPGIFLAGDLAVPEGTIMAAFNSGADVIRRIRDRYPEVLQQGMYA